MKAHVEGQFLSAELKTFEGKKTGWVEALQLMSEGDKWKLYIPYNLGYGEHGAGAAIPPYSTLVFEVELLEVL